MGIFAPRAWIVLTRLRVTPVGRWHSIDPADEFYSPYVYCHNDPVNFLDPDGAVEINYEEAGWAGPFSRLYERAQVSEVDAMEGAYTGDPYDGLEVITGMNQKYAKQAEDDLNTSIGILDAFGWFVKVASFNPFKSSEFLLDLGLAEGADLATAPLRHQRVASPTMPTILDQPMPIEQGNCNSQRSVSVVDPPITDLPSTQTRETYLPNPSEFIQGEAL